MKNILIITVALFYLGLNLGLGMRVHYCGGEPVGIELMPTETKKGCCGKEGYEKNCCSSKNKQNMNCYFRRDLPQMRWRPTGTL